MKKVTLSVLMSVYNGETADYLGESLDSILKQSLLPNQFVLVVDGIIREELMAVILGFRDNFVHCNVAFELVKLEENSGLGEALRVGVSFCTSDYIVRMDSDDISVKTRIENTVAVINEKPGFAVYGGQIKEFNLTPNDVERYRIVPLKHDDISNYGKLRNPLNHVTVCINKKALMEVGSYESLIFHEDYFLWIKFIQNTKKLLNVREVWVHVRVGNDLVGRRKGGDYFKYEKKFVNRAKEIGYFSRLEAYRYLLSRLSIRFLPKDIIQFIYSRLRK